MFVTLEDETANANLIVWPAVFEANRRPILSATMLGCRGKVQHASGVTHLIVEQVRDLSADLRRVSGMNDGFPLQLAAAMKPSMAATASIAASRKPLPIKPRDMYEPDLHIDTLTVKARNFR